MRSPIGDGARFLDGTLKVAERRTLVRTSGMFWFVAKSEVAEGVTAVGGGVAGGGGEEGLLAAPC